GGKVVGLNVGFDAMTGAPSLAPDWYYPSNQEANRMGVVSGPMTVAQILDLGTGGIDTVVLTTSVSSGEISGGQTGPNAGDTTGKVEGFVVASRGEPLTTPRGNNVAGGGNPQAGRRFVAARWLDIPPGTGQVPQPRELVWDERKHFEVRVMDKAQNYVLARYVRGDADFRLLPDGTGGQVELPPPPEPRFALPGQPNVWNLNDYVLLADYSVLPQPVDNGGQSIRPRFSPTTPYEREGNQQQVQPTGIAGGVAVGKDSLTYYGTGQGYMCAAEWRRGRAQFRWKMRSLEYAPNTGLTSGSAAEVDPASPTYLPNYAFVAAPAAGDRIVFASKGRGTGGTVYVMEPDAVIRFKLQTGPMTAAQAQQVMLQADHGVGFIPTSPFILANTQPFGRVPGQFVVDPDTSTVTFLNMENFSLNLNNVISPAEARAQYGVDTGGKPAVPISWRFQLPVGDTPKVALIPLPVVAVYQAKGLAGVGQEAWRSGPVISGDRIYLMGSSGYMHQLPLDPKRVDPRFPIPTAPNLTGFDMGNETLYGPGALRKLRAIAVGLNSPTAAAPAIGPGIVAVTTPRGLTTYTSPNVVIADSNRVVEASGDSTAVASTDVVRKDLIDVSDFAIPTDPSLANTTVNGVARPLLTERKYLSRPATVRKLNRGSSLTALFNSSSP
ncbi:MAG TPA: hypothetical protein VK689_15180, partial [Armatimonadota bacterium]|nr:hypothetical protein [Armatimonadota bacterium]